MDLVTVKQQKQTSVEEEYFVFGPASTNNNAEWQTGAVVNFF